MPTLSLRCEECHRPIEFLVGQGQLPLCAWCGARRSAEQLERADHGKREAVPALGEPEVHEEDLSGAYLSQAAESLLACRDPAVVFPPRRPVPDPGKVAEDYMFFAYPTRLTLARSAILWAAFAAEAYINVYLTKLIPDVFKKEIDRPPRWPTVSGSGDRKDKYIDGVARARGGKPLFERDKSPFSDLVRLFQLRNRLAHPKLKPIPVERRGFFPDVPGYEDFNPVGAARFLVAVAVAADTLATDAGDQIELDRTAANIVAERDAVLAFGDEAMHLPPHPDSQKPPPELPPIWITRTSYFAKVVRPQAEYIDGKLTFDLDPAAAVPYDFRNP